MTGNTGESKAPQFAIFRAKDAQPYTEMTIMEHEPMSAVATEGMQRVMSAGYTHGYDLNLLFSTPGFSLVRLWFKSGFPLPLHTHNVDCLYYIIGGSLQIGREELGVGDGFFVGRDVPYTYIAGPAGVEVLEFRAADAFNIKNLADSKNFWDKAVESVQNKQSAWAKETPPSAA